MPWILANVSAVWLLAGKIQVACGSSWRKFHHCRCSICSKNFISLTNYTNLFTKQTYMWKKCYSHSHYSLYVTLWSYSHFQYKDQPRNLRHTKRLTKTISIHPFESPLHHPTPRSPSSPSANRQPPHGEMPVHDVTPPARETVWRDTNLSPAGVSHPSRCTLWGTVLSGPLVALSFGWELLWLTISIVWVVRSIVVGVMFFLALLWFSLFFVAIMLLLLSLSYHNQKW